jgi:broad specificity phosphatase PhoE
MTRLIRYLTHPQVEIDPGVPVPDWGLSAAGRERVRALVDAGWLAGTVAVVSSGERKAVETAAPIAAGLGLDMEIREAMHENDRSATGYLPPPEFEATAKAFFAQPMVSIRGWERAIDAQARIVREVEAVLARDQPGDVLFVGHGAAGALLLCHVARIGITRSYDQPAGGGYYVTFTRERHILHPWRKMEAAPY